MTMVFIYCLFVQYSWTFSCIFYRCIIIVTIIILYASDKAGKYIWPINHNKLVNSPFSSLPVSVPLCLCLCVSLSVSVCLSLVVCVCLSPYVSVSVCLCLSVYVSLSVGLSLFLSLSQCRSVGRSGLSVCLSVCLSVSLWLSVCVSVCLSVCLSLAHRYNYSMYSEVVGHLPAPFHEGPKWINPLSLCATLNRIDCNSAKIFFKPFVHKLSPLCCMGDG